MRKMDREEYDTIKLGERVGFVFGPGEFPEHNQGTVTAKREDEWGFHAQVKMDNGSNSESVDGFTKKGIGCYRLEADEQAIPAIEKIRALEGAIVDLVMAIQKGDTQLGDEIEAVGEATEHFPEWKIEVHVLAEGGT